MIEINEYKVFWLIVWFYVEFIIISSAIPVIHNSDIFLLLFAVIFLSLFFSALVYTGWFQAGIKPLIKIRE